MTRARLEFALAGLCAFLALLTAFEPAWLEQLIEVDLDEGSGTIERSVVIALSALAVSAAALGRRHSRCGTANS